MRGIPQFPVRIGVSVTGGGGAVTAGEATGCGSEVAPAQRKLPSSVRYQHAFPLTRSPASLNPVTVTTRSFLDHSGDARVSRGSAFAQIGFAYDGDAGDEFVDAARPCGRSLLGKRDQLIAIELVAWTGLRRTDLPVQDDVGGVERDRPAARDFRDKLRRGAVLGVGPRVGGLAFVFDADGVEVRVESAAHPRPRRVDHDASVKRGIFFFHELQD